METCSWRAYLITLSYIERIEQLFVTSLACSEKGIPSGFCEQMLDLDTLVAGQQFHTTFSSKNLNWKKKTKKHLSGFESYKFVNRSL